MCRAHLLGARRLRVVAWMGFGAGRRDVVTDASALGFTPEVVASAGCVRAWGRDGSISWLRGKRCYGSPAENDTRHDGQLLGRGDKGGVKGEGFEVGSLTGGSRMYRTVTGLRLTVPWAAAFSRGVALRVRVRFRMDSCALEANIGHAGVFQRAVEVVDTTGPDRGSAEMGMQRREWSSSRFGVSGRRSWPADVG